MLLRDVSGEVLGGGAVAAAEHAQITGGRHVVLLHVLGVQLLEYKSGLRIRIRVTVQIWIRIRTHRWRSARDSSPCTRRTASRIQIRAEDPDPCYNSNLDPDPHYYENLDPYPHYSENLDPDPHYRSLEVGTWFFSMNSAYSS